MCGIVGCVGHENAVDFATKGLGFLEYRGYDSMGIAFPDPGTPQQTELWTPQLKVVKSLGGVSGINEHLAPIDRLATTAIGHTRWATHGEPSIPNTHPHTNEDGTIAVVHNGVIENHAELREDLEANGYNFSSQTDTEVIPHLFDYYLADGQEPEEAFRSTIKRLIGAYAVVACRAEQPNTVYAAKLGSPLVLGVNGNEHFASSDPRVWISNTKNAIRLDDRAVATISTEGWEVKSFHGKNIPRQPEELSDDFEQADLGDFPTWMLKEIYDQPETVRAATSGRVFPNQNIVKLGGLEEPGIQEKLRQTERMLIVACGTSYHAGLIGEKLIQEVAGIPVEVQIASEFLYNKEPLSRSTALLAISQSGETADTRAAIEKANGLGLLTLGINNTPGSTIDQITQAGVHCRAGQEVSVASTKVFTSQVAILAEMAMAMSKESNALHHPLMKELVALPDKIEQILKNAPSIEALAKKYAHYDHFLYIGRGYEQISAMEGALKLKEISYIHAEALGAGEMKHGPLALINESFPTFAIATYSPVYEKTVSNIEEIKARKGPVLALATDGNESIKNIVDDVLYVPASLEQTQPILNAIIMQLFAYYVAIERGLDVDRPRNLAKSVTVE
jgi:glucosamine--fructose-6-phosphate aminotransferase (isomerizing)